MALGEPEQLLKFLAVKAHHHLAVDYRDGCGAHPQLQEFLQGLSVFPDVFFDKRHTLLRKKLSLLDTRPSIRLGIDGHLLRHPYLPCVL